MGMHEETQSAPDTFGLPEYFVTDVVTEICGSNVRIICGARRGGQVQWLYSVIMPADRLIISAQECKNAGDESYNLLRMMDRRVAH